MKMTLTEFTLILTGVTTFAADRPTPILGLEPAPFPPSPESPSAPSLEEIQRRIEATKKFPVPEPAKTPFDADPNARRVYMDSYRSGYRRAVAGYMSTCCALAGTPHRDAVVTGHYDGQLAAVKDHPKEVLGIEPAKSQ